MSEVRRHGSRARSAIFAPLSDVGRAGQVEQRLTEAIRSGVLVEGERLPSEPELAAMLGVAVVTVREALTGLRAQGLVTTTRGRGGGTFVAADAAADEAGARRAARVDVARRAAGPRHALRPGPRRLRRAGRGARRRRRGRVAAQPAADRGPASGVGAWRHADAELWLSVAALTQSSRITREVVRLEADFGMIVRIPLGDQPFRTRTIRASHHRLIDAIAAGDPDIRAHAAPEATCRRPSTGCPHPGRAPRPPPDAEERLMSPTQTSTLATRSRSLRDRGDGVLRRALRLARGDRRAGGRDVRRGRPGVAATLTEVVEPAGHRDARRRTRWSAPASSRTPGWLADRELFLAWWQGEEQQPLAERGVPIGHHVFDYSRHEWFADAAGHRRAPRHRALRRLRVHRRVRPHRHGAGAVGGRMIGIAGADTRLETFEQLMREPLRDGGDVVLVNSHDRCVVAADPLLRSGQKVARVVRAGASRSRGCPSGCSAAPDVEGQGRRLDLGEPEEVLDQTEQPVAVAVDAVASSSWGRSRSPTAPSASTSR